MSIPSFLSKILKFIGSLFVREGLDKFLEEEMSLAVTEITKMAQEKSFAPLAEWKDEAFALLKDKTAQVKDTWVSLLVDLAYETVKAAM